MNKAKQMAIKRRTTVSQLGFSMRTIRKNRYSVSSVQNYSSSNIGELLYAKQMNKKNTIKIRSNIYVKDEQI